MSRLDTCIRQINRIRARYGDWKTPAPHLPRPPGCRLNVHKNRIQKLLDLEIEAAGILWGRAQLDVVYRGSGVHKKAEKETDRLAAAFALAASEGQKGQ